VERHTAEVVAVAILNCPSYKVQPINRVCVRWGGLTGDSPRCVDITTFLTLCNIFLL